MLILTLFEPQYNIGEQIRKIQGHVDNIEVLQDKADRHMKAINSVQGAIMNKFSSSPKQRDSNKKTDKLVEKSQKKRAKARDKEMEEEEEEEKEVHFHHEDFPPKKKGKLSLFINFPFFVERNEAPKKESVEELDEGRN